MNAPSTALEIKHLSPRRQMWRRFRQNRLGYASLIIFSILFVVSLFAEVISNDRPLLVRYHGELYTPLWHDYPETTFGGDFPTPTDYLDPFIRERLNRDGNWAIYPINTYRYDTLNYFASSPNPAPPSKDNWLGTDDRGRDILARSLYGFRISVLFGFALTLIGVVVGVVTGAIQGYFGGKTDLLFQRFIEIWGSMPELYLLLIFAAIFRPSIGLLLILLSRVRLDRAVRLCASRIPAQPQSRLRARGALARAGQPPDHVAPHPAQQHDAGDHVSAVSHQRRHRGADQSRFPRPRGAAVDAEPGRVAGARQG
jgi:microcin C transport system permease protein